MSVSVQIRSIETYALGSLTSGCSPVSFNMLEGMILCMRRMQLLSAHLAPWRKEQSRRGRCPTSLFWADTPNTFP